MRKKTYIEVIFLSICIFFGFVLSGCKAELEELTEKQEYTPEQPEQKEQPDQPDQSGQTGQSDQSDQSEHIDTQQVAIPAADPPGGSFVQGVKVMLSCATQEAEIFYTTDNSDPLTSSTRFTGPITLTEDTTLKAAALKGSMKPSDVLTVVFTNAERKVTFTGNTAQVTFDNLSNQDIYLVKVNTSGTAISAANTGGVASAQAPITDDESLERIQVFNSNPPPISTSIIDSTIQRIRSALSLQAPTINYSIGSTKNFWVETFYGSNAWTEKPATLRASGTYCNVWVLDESYDDSSKFTTDRKITSDQAQAMANKFDVIYPVETDLLGYEYGGGPGGNGGKDGDLKVEILICNIQYNNGKTAASGFFWAKDFYTNAELSAYGYALKSNLAEVFYIETDQFENYPDYIYSTLVHEFQHMINWNQKAVQHGKSSSTWFNETLSIMAEDIIAPFVGVTPDNTYHLINRRIPVFLSTYFQEGITEWKNSEASYAKGFAYGAYLMRNYGGAQLLYNILHNDKVDEESITAALNEIESGMTFGETVRRYGEALVFSGAKIPFGAKTFDKTVSTTINGHTYTATGFDIYKTGWGGPMIKDYSIQYELPPNSVLLQQAVSWSNTSGSRTIMLNMPSVSAVEMDLMVR